MGPLRPGKRSLFALGVLACSVVLVACGGDDDGSDQDSEATTATATTTEAEPEPAGITKAEFISTVDEICRETRDEISPINDQLEAAEERRDLDALAELFDAAILINQAEFDKIRAVPIPDGEEAQLEELYGRFDQLIASTERLIPALQERDVAAIQRLVPELMDADTTLDTFVQGYGFQECGQDDPAA